MVAESDPRAETSLLASIGPAAFWIFYAAAMLWFSAILAGWVL